MSFAIAVLIVRSLILPLCLYNLWWSKRCFWAVIKGAKMPNKINHAIAFLVSFALSGFQIAGLLAIEEVGSGPTTLAMALIFLVAVSLMAYSYRTGATLNVDKFYWLLASDHLSVAMSVARLNEVNPEQAKEMARFANRLVARAEINE